MVLEYVGIWNFYLDFIRVKDGSGNPFVPSFTSSVRSARVA